MKEKKESIGDSAYLEVFGDSPINRVLDFLIVFQEFDYAMADIAEQAEVSYSTLKKLLPELEKKEIIKTTRISGKSKMYKLNKENEIIKRFVTFYWDITNREIGRCLEEKEIAIAR